MALPGFGRRAARRARGRDRLVARGCVEEDAAKERCDALGGTTEPNRRRQAETFASCRASTQGIADRDDALFASLTPRVRFSL